MHDLVIENARIVDRHALHGPRRHHGGHRQLWIHHAPCRPEDRDQVIRNLTHVEGMSLEAMRAGIQWDFETYPEFLGGLERRGVVPNVASFVGHSSVRTYVLGADASRRAATEAAWPRSSSPPGAFEPSSVAPGASDEASPAP